MLKIAENLGWICFLLAIAAAAGAFSKGIFKVLWDESAKGNVVDTTDALIAMASIVMGWLQLMKSNWLATGCTVAVFFLTSGSTSVSVYASLGFSVMTFVVTGLLTPRLKRNVESLSETPARQTPQSDKSSDS
jgi:predicted phage tail protein